MTFPPTNSLSDTSGGRYGNIMIGYGLVSAPATAAHLQIVVTNNDFYHGPPQAPRTEAVPRAKARAAMVDVVDAIKTHESVSNVEVVIPTANQGLHRPVSVAKLDVDIVHPESADLTVLLNDAARAAADVDLVFGHVGARFSGPDCAALVREAKRLAIANAREEAELQAELLGVSLGDVIASAGAPPVPANVNSGTGPGITLAPFDPATQPIQVDAYRRVVMTFAIAIA